MILLEINYAEIALCWNEISELNITPVDSNIDDFLLFIVSFVKVKSQKFASYFKTLCFYEKKPNFIIWLF